MPISDTDDIKRNELKYRINPADSEILRARLGAIMQHDPHAAPHPWYTVRSLYFDNAEDDLVNSKMNGERVRSLYRIRAYNGGSSPLYLERKTKTGLLVSKRRRRISEKEYSRATAVGLRRRPGGENAWTLEDEFSSDAGFLMLRPVSLVEYRREAFVCPSLEVRVTLDTCLRAAPGSRPLFGEAVRFQRLFPDDVIILEIKYRRFLPDFISGMLSMTNRPRIAISKYTLCRAYGPA